MTVRGWLGRTHPRAPAELMQHVLAALGADADAPASATARHCLDAAERLLSRIVAEERFARDSAVDLLTVDALTTYALEHASSVLTERVDLTDFARRGTQALGKLSEQHV
jgi:hypothetical protein